MNDTTSTDPVSISRRKPSRVPRRLRGHLSLDDFERSARRLLPKSIFGYVSGGVETDASLRANRAAFGHIGLQPRILQDVSQRSLETRLFDQSYPVPFGVAPMGFSALAAFDGDVVLARGAASAGSFAICSAASLTPLERVAREGGSRWFQAYIPGNMGRIEPLLKRVSSAGFDHLVVTGDVPVAGNRENNARNGFDAPFRITPQLVWQGITHPRWTLGTLGREIAMRGMPHFENMEAVQGPPLFSRDLVRSTIERDRLCWEDIRRIRDLWSGRLIVKGVLHPDDARMARTLGCDGVIVSNHGGRQLDTAVSPLQVLPSIREAVPEMPVMFDSGIRRGTDVLKAIMLGADFVFVGRPFLYAAATHGEDGVRHVAALLREEVDRDMALLGITTPLQMREAAELSLPR
ncbi:alpha-hydroxy-acid oxidizing protein [Nitratireductor aquimarinus]|uniref:alpha-hydroxy acid oxidase n=1 Tax=Alphaproteobacteria TaxID=28211 RepID=UPI0019D3D7B4|nr:MULTISPECIES: alpha-hydroxy acid oxidase [Alphaproteobacteria]MBN7758185.1 alpha-hydroxy-acid oxidizing protein [Nitratireductor aquimarinus]MBY6000946.1 alpha-hydroxy-acid oxidizing protein [Tritonibacter mobilis]MBY6022978.1 alpha-hydroxy-acid oxidizing protein [Nitratireductor sp. DP7N14-4]